MAIESECREERQRATEQDTAEREGERTANGEPESEREVAASKHYMKKTVFRAALLGEEMRKKKREREGEEWEGEVDGRLLGPIQRYDRLNHVLSLLQRVQESESDGGREGEGVKLSSLQEHIQTALDEAVRLRADTDSLHTKVTRKSTNPVRTT